MDKFVLIIGIAGLILLIISLVVLVTAILYMIQGQRRIRRLLFSIVVFLITLGFASSFIYLSLFLQTFSRYTHEEKIGWVYARSTESRFENIAMTFFDEEENRMHWFNVSGDQWVIEAYFLRWSLALRWLGAGSYYRVTRFTGRWEVPDEKKVSPYQLYPEDKLWKFLLKHGDKIPFIDATYGIGAFQYPNKDTFDIYINDTGFILRHR